MPICNKDIADPESLREAAESGRIREMEGFGATLEANFLEEIRKKSWGRLRTPWHVAEKVARAYVAYLAADESVGKVVVAGSFRRRKATFGDLHGGVLGIR